MNETPFSKYLSALLAERGAVARLAERSGVSRPFISRMMAGEVLPSVEMLHKLLGGVTLPADRDHLALEYVRLHLPAGVPNVRVLLNDEATPRDRLTRACDLLDAPTRESLAVLVEAVNRAPELGSKAIQSLAAVVGVPCDAVRPVGRADDIAMLAEPGKSD